MSSRRMSPSSLEDSAQTTQEKMTTKSIMLNETRMSRTAEVRQRLGPIMERMKSSLSKIQILEESLNLHVSGDSGGDGKSEITTGNSQDIESASKPLHSSNALVIAPGSNQSRQLLKSSMSMLKKKLSTLQRMEDILNASEDRRQNLQHYFLQASLSKPMLELACVKRENQSLERQLTLARKECQSLEDKCSKFDSLQQRLLTLSDAVQRMSNIEDELFKARKTNAAYEDDLLNRQTEISRLSMRCQELECQVDELSSLCESLEEQLGGGSGSGSTASPRKISPRDSIDGRSTAQTESDSDSLTNRSSLAPESPPGSPHRSANAFSDFFLESSADPDDMMSLLGVIDLGRLSGFEDDDLTSSLPEGLGPVVIHRLLAKLDKLEKENEELKLQNQASEKKMLAMTGGNHSRILRTQTCELGRRTEEAASSDQDDIKVPRGNLFGFLKSSPTQTKKAHNYKARLT